MKSQWIEFKEAAIALRQSGQSIKTIHQNLGIPSSTLSGWLKDVELTAEHRNRLQQNKKDGWERAHQKAADWHRTQKALRTLKSKQEAQRILKHLTISDEVLDIALAMLLFGGSPRKESTPVSSSNPTTLRFIMAVLSQNYGVNLETIRCDLSLRADQDDKKLKEYWAKELSISPTQFKSTIIDKRSTGKPTNGDYKGVCIIGFNSVAAQRKLRYLYTLFCERIADVNLGT
jgi:transposase-like protein